MKKNPKEIIDEEALSQLINLPDILWRTPNSKYVSGEKGSKFEYTKFCVPASDKSIHSGAFSFNKKLTNPPKGVKGIE